MKLTLTTNIDFNKLANNISKNLSDGTNRIARSAAKGATEKIESGTVRKLEDSTLSIRKRRQITGSKPLYETGNLHRSIKQIKINDTESAVEMLGYGMLHHKGFTTPPKSLIPGKNVEPRPFIMPSEKEILDPIKKIHMDIRKSLRSNMRTIK